MLVILLLLMSFCVVVCAMVVVPFVGHALGSAVLMCEAGLVVLAWLPFLVRY